MTNEACSLCVIIVFTACLGVVCETHGWNGAMLPYKGERESSEGHAPSSGDVVGDNLRRKHSGD